MRLDRIVRLRQNTMWNQIDLFFLFRCQTYDDVIDRVVLFGQGAMGLLASLTNALMNTRLIRWAHDRSSRNSSDNMYFAFQVIKHELFVKQSSYF
jgi:hypothetical protein